MALPVANLGYMPNMGSPGRGPTTVIEDPWQALATQALTTVLQQGITNSLQKDYTEQAKNEGLAIDPEAKAAAWYKKPFTGATTDKAQVQQLRGEKQQNKRALLAENAALQRHAESEAGAERRLGTSIAATREEGAANRASQVDLRKLDQLFQSTEGQAVRAHQAAMQVGDQTAAMERLDKEIRAKELSLGRQLSAEERMLVTRSFMDNVGKMSIQDKTAKGLMNQSLGLPPPTTNSQDIDAYAKELERLGFKVLPPGEF